MPRQPRVDQPAVRYAITGGNVGNLFSINPVTGEVTVNGLLGWGAAAQQQLQITATDNFAPNPKSSVHQLTLNLSGSDLADANGNGIPDVWENAYGLTNPAANGDSDADGTQHFFEFLGGTDPTLPDSAQGVRLQVAKLVSSPVAGVELEWRARNGVVLGQHYYVETNVTLGGAWTPLNASNYQVISTTDDGPGFSKLRIFIPNTESASFFRLREGP
jgi:hypothetical protein